jgi:hypothetical protein
MVEEKFLEFPYSINHQIKKEDLLPVSTIISFLHVQRSYLQNQNTFDRVRVNDS